MDKSSEFPGKKKAKGTFEDAILPPAELYKPAVIKRKKQVQRKSELQDSDHATDKNETGTDPTIEEISSFLSPPPGGTKKVKSEEKMTAGKGESSAEKLAKAASILSRLLKRTGDGTEAGPSTSQPGRAEDRPEKRKIKKKRKFEQLEGASDFSNASPKKKQKKVIAKKVLAAVATKVGKKKKSVQVAKDTDRDSQLEKKIKKPRAPTGFTLWSKKARQSLYTGVEPGDQPTFSEVSKRVGEMWTALPERDKLMWQNKAKKMKSAGSTLISTGRQKPPSKKQLKLQQQQQEKLQAQQQKPGAKMKKFVEPPKKSPPKPKKKSAADADIFSSEKTRVTGTAKRDQLAHIHVIAHSILTLGMKLKANEGLQVQGVMTTMMDAMISSFVPVVLGSELCTHTRDAITERQRRKLLHDIQFIAPASL